MIYEFKKYDMTVTFGCREDSEPIVEFVLGSEMRIFRLHEFTNFWLAMLEEGRRAATDYLDALPRRRKRRAERTGKPV